MKISEQIIEVLEYLGEKFGIAIDWSSETVLPVIQTLCGKYIRWEIATSVVWVVIGIILLAIGFIALPKAIAALERYREDYDEDCGNNTGNFSSCENAFFYDYNDDGSSEAYKAYIECWGESDCIGEDGHGEYFHHECTHEGCPNYCGG